MNFDAHNTAACKPISPPPGMTSQPAPRMRASTAWSSENHLRNFLLWHEEDIARRDDLGCERVYQAKRAIDRYNQERNNFIEEMDQALVVALRPSSDAWLSAEFRNPGHDHRPAFDPGTQGIPHARASHARRCRRGAPRGFAPPSWPGLFGSAAISRRSLGGIDPMRWRPARGPSPFTISSRCTMIRHSIPNSIGAPAIRDASGAAYMPSPFP